MIPKKISVEDKKFLKIVWNDEAESKIPLSDLRKNCPCAGCRDEREKQTASYIPLYSAVQLTLTDIKTVGNYAVQLYWQDGHKEGIWTYDRLEEFITA